MLSVEERYPWYDIVDTPNLDQGDIIVSCPAVVPVIDRSEQKALNALNDEGPPTGMPALTGDVECNDVIVMSQACDLAQEKVRYVILCPIWTVSKYREINPQNPGKFKDFCNKVIKGQVYAWSMIAACELEGFRQEPSLVDFRVIYNLPLEYVTELVSLNPRRLRLLPPYREHLSQAFARFFMRVGLPIPIPSLDISTR